MYLIPWRQISALSFNRNWTEELSEGVIRVLFDRKKSVQIKKLLPGPAHAFSGKRGGPGVTFLFEPKSLIFVLSLDCDMQRQTCSVGMPVLFPFLDVHLKYHQHWTYRAGSCSDGLYFGCC